MKNLKTYESFLGFGKEKSTEEILTNLRSRMGKSGDFENVTENIGKFNFQNDEDVVEFYYNDFPVESEYVEILEDGTIKFSKMKVDYNPIDVTDLEPNDYPNIEHDYWIEEFNSIEEFVSWYKKRFK